MSARARMGLFAVLVLPLIIVAALLIASDEPEDPAAAPTTRATPSDAELAAAAEQRARALEATRRRERQRNQRLIRRERRQLEGLHHGEPGPKVVPAYPRTERETVPVARRFFAAYSLYEVGRLDRGVRSALRRTAGAEFAGQLLAAPPRALAGGEPARARLGELQLVPVSSSGGDPELSVVELVGEVRRGGERTTLAITLERDGEGWRATGLGR